MKVKQTIGSIGILAVLMLSTPLAAATAPSGGFSDVPTTHPNYSAIMDLKERGIIGGYPDGTYKPDQVVNRVEALKIILLGTSIDVPDASGTGGFSDTLAGEWYAKYLLKAKELKIVGGYPDGTFKPTQTVNLVENLKMLINTKSIDLTNVTVTENPYADAMKDQWYAPFVEYAKTTKWITADGNNMIYPSQGMTRGKLAQLMYNAMHTTSPEPSPTPNPTPTPDPTPADLNVSIESSGFIKNNMTIAQGTKVRWTNKDAAAHTVTSDSGTFDSGNLSNGQTFDFTFSELGTFSYHCALHPEMTGTIIVKKPIEVPTI